MDLNNDDLLVRQTIKGSQEAFAELVGCYQGVVFSLCYRMVGNTTEAEDLAQESFLRLYGSLGKFRSGMPLRPWLLKITANICLDALRKRKQVFLPLDDVPEDGFHPESHQADEMPEEVFLSRETRLEVQKALLGLPGDYRIALVLRYLEDLSYQEIADTLGVPLSTIETRIFRAKKMLASILAPSIQRREEDTSHDLPMGRRTDISLR